MSNLKVLPLWHGVNCILAESWFLPTNWPHFHDGKKQSEETGSGFQVPTVFLGRHFEDCSKSQVVCFRARLTKQTIIIIIIKINLSKKNTFDGSNSYHILCADYVPSLVKHSVHLTSFFYRQQHYEEIGFYHFCFTVTGAKARRGPVFIIFILAHFWPSTNGWWLDK